jgi:hypothetical protein
MRVLLHFPGTTGAAVATLARGLQARGHDVACTVLDDADLARLPAATVRVPVHRRVPLRRLLERRHAASTEQREWLRLEIDARVAQDYFEGEMLGAVAALAPDVIVADAGSLSPLPLVAHELRIPCQQLTLTLPRGASASPPLTSHARADASALQVAGARWESSCLNRRLAGIPVPMQVASAIERLAVSAAYPARAISLTTAMAPALTLFPEASVAEACFDVESARGANSYWAIEPATPPQRDSFATAAPRGPVVYVELDEAGAAEPLRANLARCLAAVFADGCEWSAVTGNRGAAHDAPRQWWLERAAAFITTAGLDAVRDAIACHVPMIAIPLAADQPGNAMRVEHHGIGMRLRAELLTPALLRAALREVLANQANAERLRRLDAACREERATSNAIEQIERRVAARDLIARATPVVPAARSSGSVWLDALDADGAAGAALEYALWCVERVLATLVALEPDRVAAIRALLGEYRERWLASDADALRPLRRRVCELAAAHWHRGFGVSVCALHPQPREAALLARLEGIAALARNAVDESGTGTERSRAFTERYVALAQEFDGELRSRIEPCGSRAVA